MTEDFLKGVVVGALLIWLPLVVASALIDGDFTPKEKLFLYELCKEK